jgi:hypothetical protein
VGGLVFMAAAVAGTDVGGLGQPGAGHGLAGSDQGGIGLAGTLALAGLPADGLLVLNLGGRIDGRVGVR